MPTAAPPIPSVGVTIRFDTDVYDAMCRVVKSRGKNRYVQDLVRADLEKRGELKPTTKEKKVRPFDW